MNVNDIILAIEALEHENRALRADLKKWEKWGLANDLPPKEPREIWINFSQGGGSSQSYYWSEMGAKQDAHGNGAVRQVLFREVL